MSASDAEKAGWEAFKIGAERSDNPYPAESQEHADWDYGWHRAWRYWND